MRRIGIYSIILTVLSGLYCSSTFAQPLGVPSEARKEPTPGMWQKSLAGGMLGPWFVGDLGNDIAEPNVRLDASGTAFHLEFFYQPHLTGGLNLEASMGAINRGDLRIRETQGGGNAFGNATLYPINLGAVFYPAAKKTGLRLQPFVKTGGSLVIGTVVLEVVNDLGYGLSEETRTTWGYFVGGGTNWVLAPSVCLTGAVKYQYAKFDKELFGAKDYSGILVLFGAAYMYR